MAARRGQTDLLEATKVRSDYVKLSKVMELYHEASRQRRAVYGGPLECTVIGNVAQLKNILSQIHGSNNAEVHDPSARPP